MAEVQEMRGEKIYECDLNITGVTDYGVTLDALLSGKEKAPLQGHELMWRSREISKAASPAKYVVAPNTSWYVPTDALTSTAEPQLKPKTAIGSPCTLRVLQRRERMNRCWTSLRTCVSPPQPRSMIGSTRGRFGLSPR